LEPDRRDGECRVVEERDEVSVRVSAQKQSGSRTVEAARAQSRCESKGVETRRRSEREYKWDDLAPVLSLHHWPTSCVRSCGQYLISCYKPTPHLCVNHFHYPQRMLDKLLAPNTHEAAAYNHLTKNGPVWHTGHSSVDESSMAGCASYSAFARYIRGEDLFLLPRTRIELESILRTYAYNAIHNSIAVSRSQILEGGYSRVCHLARVSIHGVLNTGDNAEILLALHQPETMTSNHAVDDCKCNNSFPITTG
jgi:hypothetical protein